MNVKPSPRLLWALRKPLRKKARRRSVFDTPPAQEGVKKTLSPSLGKFAKEKDNQLPPGEPLRAEKKATLPAILSYRTFKHSHFKLEKEKTLQTKLNLVEVLRINTPE